MAGAPHPLEEASALADVLRSLAEHRDEDALANCLRILQGDPASGPAHHLAGVALMRLGRAAQALVHLDQAAVRLPDRAPVHLARGNALRAVGHPEDAASAYRLALRHDPGSEAALFNLADLHAAAGRAEESAAAFVRLARSNPLDFDAAQRAVGQVARLAAQSGRDPALTGPEASPACLGELTVGFCSIDPEREARARASLSAGLAPWTVHFRVIHDARSLSEAFNRIVDEARTEFLVLCHDDIQILSPGAGHRLHEGLAAADILGVAGATRACGPAVLWAGHPHVHGWVSYPREGAIEAAPLSFRCGRIDAIEALDGVFLATRTATARGLRFDEARFDGFHFYDLDFTYRAHLAGLRLAVTTDILLLHDSEGSYDDEWKRYAQRFLEKHPSLDAPRGQSHWYGARLPDARATLRFYGWLQALSLDTKVP